MKVSFALCVLVLLIAVLQFASHWLDIETDQFQRASIHWLSAVEQTKTKLEHTLQLLENDKAFPYALGEKQIYSVNRLLKSKEKQGEVTALGIYQGNCKLITKSRAGIHPIVPCNKKFSGDKYWSRLRYHPGKKVASVSVWTKVHLGRRSFWLFAETILDKDWMLRFETIKQVVAEIELKVQHRLEPGFKPIRSFEAFPPFYLVAKTSVLWQVVSIVVPPKNMGILLFSLLTLAFFVTVFVLFQGEQARIRSRRIYEDLGQWCQKLFSQDPSRVTLPKVITAADEWPEILTIKQSFSKLLAGYSKTIKGQSAKLDRCEQRSRNLAQDLSTTAYELAKEPFLVSLAKQVEDQSLHIKGEITDTNHLLEDFSDVLHLALVPELQKLQELSRNWKEGCRAYSPRKYLRTLSERAGSQGGDQLSEELEHLYGICHSSINIAINLSIQSRRAIAKTRRVQGYMDHWNCLADAKAHTEPGAMIRPMIRDSIKLVESQLRGSELAIEGLELVDVRVDDLNIPAFIWQSVFYHMFLYLYYRSPSYGDGEVVIQLDFIKKGRDRYLLMRSPRQGADPESLSTEAKIHLELASKISKALPLNVEPLPTLKEEEVLSITWQLGEGVCQEPRRPSLENG